MEKYKFYSALSHCYETYGVELDEDQFETYAMSAWRKIGNKDYKMYLLKANPICDNEGGWYVCLPCNCNTIEAITERGNSQKILSGSPDAFEPKEKFETSNRYIVQNIEIIHERIYSIILYAAISYSDIKLLLISWTISFNYSSTSLSFTPFPFIISNIEF